MTIDDPIANRRKKLKFRAWHRGTREMDLLLGSFADAHVLNFDAAQLDAFERLLNCPDPDLYDWKCGLKAPDVDEASDVMRLFIAHQYAA
jgi:antitoxin CptB